MPKELYAVAIGRVPGIYTNWTHAKAQVEGFSLEKYAGFDTFDECVNFMTANGDHTENNIMVFGPRGGQHTLREWLRKHSIADHDMTTSINDGNGPQDTHTSQTQGHAIVSQQTNDIVDNLDVHQDVNDITIMDNAMTDVMGQPHSTWNDTAVSGITPHHQSSQTNVKIAGETAHIPVRIQGVNPTAPPFVPATLTQTDTCRACTLLQPQISALHQIIKDLSSNVNQLSTSLNTVVRENSNMLHTLSTEINKHKWTQMDHTPANGTLLLGSSMIRNVDKDKMVDTEVKCINGARLPELTTYAKRIPKDTIYKRIVIVGGGNDCSDKDTDMETIIERGSVLFKTLKAHSNDITMASVCPRTATIKN